MVCSICKKEINDTAYVEIVPHIVIQSETKEPLIFSSAQQRSYYATKIVVHDKCFISLVGTNTELKIVGGLGLVSVSS